MKRCIRVGGWLAWVVWWAGIMAAQGGMVTVTVQNAATSYLDLYSPQEGYVNVDFGGYNANPNTTFVLDDTHTYYLGTYLHATAGAHEFSFSGGQIVPGGTAPVTSEFFSVSGNNIFVQGIRLTVQFISSPSNDPYQYIQFNAGGLDAPTVAPFLGGPPVAVGYLVPADSNFDGSYPLYFFGPETANDATLTLGTNIGVASLIGTGTTFVPSGPHSILATLSNGNVFEFTAIPEPSMLLLALLGLLSVRGFRAWRRS